MTPKGTLLKIVAVLAIIFIVLGVVVLTNNPLRAGVVTAKQHYEHSERTYFIAGVIPMMRSEPEKYVIWVASRNTVEEWEVSKELFDRLRLGQFITRQEAGKK